MARTEHAADDLPLLYRTPPHWADAVLAQPLALLNDHAHLEKKAAANAFEMLTRWPEPNPPEQWVARMCSIARDEAEHLGLVTRLLTRRGGRLTRNHANPYANDLRQLVGRGGPDELGDRLMISALIEARSAERFGLLAAASDDRDLSKLYRSLYASECGHYRIFIDLAGLIRPAKIVERRWRQMLESEARIIAAQPPGPRMHSGVS